MYYKISITVDVYEDGVKLETILKEDKYISEEVLEALIVEDKGKEDGK